MTDDDQNLLERIEAIIANAWDDDEHETLSEARDRIQALIAENERIASGRYSGVMLTSFPPKDPAVEEARAALGDTK